MSRSAINRSLLSKLFAALVVVFGVALLVGAAAVLRWREVGWGGFVWLAALLAMMAIRTPYALRCRDNVIVDNRNDHTDRLLLAAMALGGFVLPFSFLATPFLDVADYDLPGWATAVGAALQLPTLWLLWRSHADLGRNWSPGLEVRNEHALVTGGVYTRIRHPMYAGCGCGPSPSRCCCTTGSPVSSSYPHAQPCISCARRVKRR